MKYIYVFILCALIIPINAQATSVRDLPEGIDFLKQSKDLACVVAQTGGSTFPNKDRTVQATAICKKGLYKKNQDLIKGMLEAQAGMMLKRTCIKGNIAWSQVKVTTVGGKSVLALTQQEKFLEIITLFLDVRGCA